MIPPALLLPPSAERQHLLPALPSAALGSGRWRPKSPRAGAGPGARSRLAPRAVPEGPVRAAGKGRPGAALTPPRPRRLQLTPAAHSSAAAPPSRSCPGDTNWLREGTGTATPTFPWQDVWLAPKLFHMKSKTDTSKI